MLIRTILTLMISASTVLSFAQKAPIKLGKVNISDLEMTHYEKDSSAGAVVLCDYGVSKIIYTQTEGFQIQFERLTRIKIFNKNEYDWGNVEVQLYHNGTSKERISGLKGYSHNLENGKIITSKVQKKSVFEEEYDKNRDLIKFALPNVREGSVIEYTYKITSDFLFNFFDWEFQKSIPVVWSEYNTQIPEYFQYQKVTQGYLGFRISESKSRAGSISITNKTRSGGHSTVKTNYSTSTVDFVEFLQRLVVVDAPAFKSEPNMTTSRNYISKIIYELAYTKFPQEPKKNIMGDWPKLNKEYLESDDFGKKLRGFIALNKVVEKLLIGIDDPLEKASIIYNHIKNKVTWNKKNGTVLNATIGNAYDTGKGDVVQINLLLANMLRKAGITVDPVLISTRNHGIIRTQFPIASQFNYVVCKVNIGDKYYLLDATDRSVPFGVLPQRCLNGEGWVVSKTNSGWIKLDSKIKTGSKISGQIKINEEGYLTGTITKNYIGYSGFSERQKYRNKGEDKFINDKTNSSDWSIEKFTIENSEQSNSDFVEKIEFEVEEDLAANMIYLNPILINEWDENPFKLENRKYPIDFGSPISNIYYVTMEIPEGYIIDEKPESVAFGLPNKAGSFVYQINESGNNLIIMSKLNITKTFFLPDEYEYIKTFFSQIVSKHKEQIVLKQQ